MAQLSTILYEWSSGTRASDMAIDTEVSMTSVGECIRFVREQIRHAVEGAVRLIGGGRKCGGD
jgi:hypothetical protein